MVDVVTVGIVMDALFQVNPHLLSLTGVSLTSLVGEAEESLELMVADSSC